MTKTRTLAQPAAQPNEVTEAFAEFWAANLGVVATQATNSIKRTTEQTAYRATLGPVYELQRVFCMSGRQAEIIAKEFKGGAPRPETGELCMLILEHSADIERDPAALRARPDKALLAPFSKSPKTRVSRAGTRWPRLSVNHWRRYPAALRRKPAWGPVAYRSAAATANRWCWYRGWPGTLASPRPCGKRKAVIHNRCRRRAAPN